MGIAISFVVFIVLLLAVDLVVKGSSPSSKRSKGRSRRAREYQRQTPRVKMTYSRSSDTKHEDHTRPIKHDSKASFRRNKERDTVFDKPLSEAERNVLYGK